MHMCVGLCVSHNYIIIFIMITECDGIALEINVVICLTHNCEVSCVVITVTSTSNVHHGMSTALPSLASNHFYGYN